MADANGEAEKDKNKFADSSQLNAPDALQRARTIRRMKRWKRLNAQWHKVRSRLRAELGEATFNSWFKLLEVAGAQKAASSCMCRRALCAVGLKRII